MLLISFHGGSGGTKNVYSYSTKDGTLKSQTALKGVPGSVKLDELRALVVHGSKLFVVSGAKKTSTVLVFGPPNKDGEFNYIDTMISEGQSIMHPFGLAFDPSSSHCYISNQDSNVVAKVKLSAEKHGSISGKLGSGCQSSYLSGKYPPPAAFLDGTFVASQTGELAGINLKNIPDVKKNDGGLGVDGKGTPIAAANSVRDVAIANGILFACDEVHSQVNMYSLTDGTFLGAGTPSAKPTHLAVHQNGLWVSADETLCWSALPASVSGASLSFHNVAITVPAQNKIGGISFDDAGSVYVVFQDGTHVTGSGSIGKCAVTAGSPPTLSSPTTFATTTNDTPEFCLWVSRKNWAG